jgi:hypothetical protein
MVFGEVKDFFFVEEEKFDELIFFVVEEGKETILNFELCFLGQNL